MGESAGHTQSLIFASTLILAGVQTIIVGLLGDVISANRKILQDIQYHVRKMDYDKESGRDEANYDEIAITSDLLNKLENSIVTYSINNTFKQEEKKQD